MCSHLAYTSSFRTSSPYAANALAPAPASSATVSSARSRAPPLSTATAWTRYPPPPAGSWRRPSSARRQGAQQQRHSARQRSSGRGVLLAIAELRGSSYSAAMAQAQHWPMHPPMSLWQGTLALYNSRLVVDGGGAGFWFLSRLPKRTTSFGLARVAKGHQSVVGAIPRRRRGPERVGSTAAWAGWAPAYVRHDPIHLGFACPPPRHAYAFLVFGEEVTSDRQRVRDGRVMLVPWEEQFVIGSLERSVRIIRRDAFGVPHQAISRIQDRGLSAAGQGQIRQRFSFSGPQAEGGTQASPVHILLDAQNTIPSLHGIHKVSLSTILLWSSEFSMFIYTRQLFFPHQAAMFGIQGFQKSVPTVTWKILVAFIFILLVYISHIIIHCSITMIIYVSTWCTL